jgi:superfamily II DNA/RNA helicase
VVAFENAATLVRRFSLSVLPVERPSAPRRKRRRGTPLAAAPAVASTAARAGSFAAASVPAQLVAALAATGITTPFPIQAATLPDALAGRDILGRGQTGSGKTLGFCIPLAARLADGYTSACRPRGLVLVPTRELASQVHAVLATLAGSVGLRVATIYGGVPQRPQVAMLRDRADIIVACPGRLADLIEQGHCHLGDVEISVLDEADHMADLGFLPVVRRLLDMTPPEGQRMLFSATLDSAVDVLARRFMNDPARHDIGPVRTPAAMVHHLLTVAPADRGGVVAALAGGSGRSLVFTRTKHAARRLAHQLAASGISAAELHGDLSQGVRERNLASFAAGAVRVIVATDIAARGIHVDGIDLVIHADSPAEHKAYLHRSGRTARAGATGTVITLQTPAQAGAVRDLMRKAGVVPLTAAVHPGSALLHSIAGESAPPVKLPADRAEVIAAAPASGRAAAALSAGFRGRRGR